MDQAMDRETFEEMLDAIHLVQSTRREYERKRRALKAGTSEKKKKSRFQNSLDQHPEADRTKALDSITAAIEEFKKREERIVKLLETDFVDRKQNLRSYLDGGTYLKMTNPVTHKVHPIFPNGMRTVLYYVLLFERRIQMKSPFAPSDYKEIEQYFRKEKCLFPEELFCMKEGEGNL